jgi:hypothetical protein
MPAQGGGPIYQIPQTSPAPSNAVQRYGIRASTATTDISNFLKTEWINYNGMNNVLLYASGVYQQAGSSAPYTGNNTVGSSTDSINGTTVNTVSAAQWAANGEVSATSLRAPTVGLYFIVNALGTGANADVTGVFQFPSVPEGNRRKSSYNSYMAIGAMWIGDTPWKRQVLYGGTSTENTLIGRANLPNPLTGSPLIAGTGSSYTETISQNPAQQAVGGA